MCSTYSSGLRRSAGSRIRERAAAFIWETNIYTLCIIRATAAGATRSTAAAAPWLIKAVQKSRVVSLRTIWSWIRWDKGQGDRTKCKKEVHRHVIEGWGLDMYSCELLSSVGSVCDCLRGSRLNLTEYSTVYWTLCALDRSHFTSLGWDIYGMCLIKWKG